MARPRRRLAGARGAVGRPRRQRAPDLGVSDAGALGGDVPGPGRVRATLDRHRPDPGAAGGRVLRTTGAPPDGRAPDLSVVIVTWNVRELVVDCLRAVAERSGALDVEAIVVDNGS